MPLILKKAQQAATPKIEPYSYDSFKKCFFIHFFANIFKISMYLCTVNT